MRRFDFYEFAGLLVPGATVLVAVAAAFPLATSALSGTSLGFGEVAAGAVLAYGLGHVVQALGNLLEAVWWKLLGGMPTEWVGNGVSSFLHRKQLDALPAKIAEQLGLEGVALDGGAQWHGITRQIYATVSAAGRAKRVDIFNGNYGLCRGLAASFLLIAVLVIVELGLSQPSALVLTGVAFLLSGWRAHRFAVHYARELYVQLLQLKSPRETASA